MLSHANFLITAAEGAAAVTCARQRITAGVRSLGVELDEDRACAVGVVISELVTNAVVHGRGLLLVHAKVSRDRLLIEIFDGSPAEPTPRLAAPDEETGRGLVLVQALALAHGWRPTIGGKCCWALMDLSAAGTTDVPEKSASFGGFPTTSEDTSMDQQSQDDAEALHE